MNADGSEKHALTRNEWNDEAPAWSPDGSKIAFQSARNSETQIFIMDSDGGAATQLTFGPDANRYPSWSPARLIAFESERDGNAQIYVMSEDGGNQHPVTTSEAQDSRPSWGPAP